MIVTCKNRWMACSAAIVCWLVSPFATASDDDSPLFERKVSSLKVPAKALGNDWRISQELVLDDLSDLSDQPEKIRVQFKELAKQFKDIGVVGMAEIAYLKKQTLPHQVTIRVFVFETEKQCRDWWEKKYQYDGWEKHYRVVPDLAYQALDSTQLQKRAVRLGNVWMTSSVVFDGDDHLKILELYLKRLRKAAKKKH